MIQSLYSALEATPDNVPLRLHLAHVLEEAGQGPDALREYGEVVARAPQEGAARLGRGRVLLALGRPEEAIPDLRAAVAAGGKTGEAHLCLARAYLRVGEAGLARHEYEQARAADPSLLDADLAALASGEGPRKVPVAAPAAPPDPDEDERYADDHGSPVPPVAGISPERPKITFADVGGLEGLKKTVRMQIIAPLERPELFAQYRKRVGGGILLYGPPGCGKTYLARATAGESKATFFAVGLHDVMDMWMGNSEKNVHQVFEAARGAAPAILFIDEVDALGGSRREMLHHYRTLVDAFLSEMDGVASSNERILVVGATNTPWHVDPAFRRPGRFDRSVFVPPPDDAAREAILRIHLAGRPTAAMDLRPLSKRTDGYSGADLREVIERAAEGILEEALDGKPERPIGLKDIEKSLREVKASTGEWLETARSYATYSNQAGVYTEILEYLSKKKR